MTKRIDESPNLVQYCRLLLALIAAQKAGLDRNDRIEEQLDTAWKAMTAEEVLWSNQFSGMLRILEKDTGA